MIPYFLLIFLPLIVWVISKRYRIISGNAILYETKTGFVDVFMVIFLLLLCLRGLPCGNDTLQYLNLYREYSAADFFSLFSDYEHEFGYKLLNKLVGTVVDNYQVFLSVTAVICVVPVWYFYKKESENEILTIALFLTVAPFVMYFSGIRQAISMGLGIPAWYLAKNKKLWWFIAIVILAMQFHLSAFVLVAIYPLYHAKITKKWLWFVVPLIAAVYFFKKPIFNFLLTLLWDDYDAITETGATTVLMLLVIFAIYSYVIPDDALLDKDTIALRNLLLLSVVIQIFAMLHPLSMRMNYYFLLFVPVLIPKIAKRSKKRYTEVAKASVVIMSVYFLYYFISGIIIDRDTLNTIPYIPFWADTF